LLVVMYVELNVVGMITLLLLLRNIRHSEIKEHPIDQLLFNMVMWTILFIFLFDTGMWLSDGKKEGIFYVINYLSATMYYVLNSVLCVLWLSYTDYKIYESLIDLKKRLPFYSVPAIFCAVLSLCSPFSGWFFVIDTENIYARGDLIWIMEVVGAFYLLSSAMLPVLDYRKSRWKESKKVNFYLVMFPVSILLCTVVQFFFYGLSIIWIGALLACISLYINIQNREITTDHLTGLFNRRRLEQHLQRRSKAKRKGNILFAVMMDMDDFKKINDTQGHATGDIVLKKTAEILKQCSEGSEDLVARLGGDEFVIVGERNSEDEIIDLMERIMSTAEQYNDMHDFSYEIKISMGYSVIQEGDTIDLLLNNADKEMYRNKSKRKEINK